MFTTSFALQLELVTNKVIHTYAISIFPPELDRQPLLEASLV